ncbi:malate synthase [Amphibacillus indicireducens]|uniref:Malate synthase n=1 Tax=Amphibacillus indicireducens TaxID=1076330 RepID=A0ABP7W3M7_9BACI
MNLVNEMITHKVFGKGQIIEQDDAFITIDFEEDTKKFVYPDSLGNFIHLKDREVAKSLEKILIQTKKEKQLREQEREEEQRQIAEEAYRRERLKNLKIHESSQVVFWLDEEEQNNVIDNWTVFTGEVQSGKNKGKPNIVARLRPNSSVLLTVREADQAETVRKVIGLYMVPETFSGDDNEDGMIEAHEVYRIKLTETEAEKILFWNYYLNKNYPHRTTWNSGKYRYFDNMITAQILKDIVALKTDEAEIKQAEDFLQYFSEMNLLDLSELPEASGALKQ